MPVYLIVLLSLCGGIGTVLAIASAVANLVDNKKVLILGMVRVVLLWPLAVWAACISESRRRK